MRSLIADHAVADTIYAALKMPLTRLAPALHQAPRPRRTLQTLSNALVHIGH